MWDLITYLRVTFAHLAALPTAVREAIHFASCIHIAKSLEQLLCGATVRKLNMAGIANFQRNVDALLEYVRSIGIQQLSECFLALTQLLELLLSGQADKFLDPHQRCVSLSVSRERLAIPRCKEQARRTNARLGPSVPLTQRGGQVLALGSRDRRERAGESERRQDVAALGLVQLARERRDQEDESPRLSRQDAAQVRQQAASVYVIAIRLVCLLKRVAVYRTLCARCSRPRDDSSALAT